MRCGPEDGKRGAGSHCLDLLLDSEQDKFATLGMYIKGNLERGTTAGTTHRKHKEANLN